MQNTATHMVLSKLGGDLIEKTLALTPPNDHEVQLSVNACALNFADLLLMNGTYQEKHALPFSPGMEISGEIIAKGAKVPDQFAVGDCVLSYCGVGGLSELINLPYKNLLSAPQSADPTSLAALPITFGTAHLALKHRANLKRDETLLVLGAAGGAGLTAITIGKLLGAHVIACARGQEKLEVAEKYGADHTIDSDDQDIRSEVLRLGGADVVFDPVGGEQFHSAFRACNPEARILPIGFASGDVPQIPANILLVKNISVIGFNLSAYRKFAPELLNESLNQVLSWYLEGAIDPHVSHTFPLNKSNGALDLLRSRKASGKIVIDMKL